MTVRRISIGPGEIAGYFSRLRVGFDELGVPCEHFVLRPNPFAYPESSYFLKEAIQRAVPLRESKNWLIRLFGRSVEMAIRLAVFLYALVRCDVFIFTGFGSFFWFYELPLLKLLGKKVIVIYLGSDARPPLFSGRHLDDKDVHVESASSYEEAIKMVKRIRKVEGYADVIINHTATSQYFLRPFVRLLAVGIPINVQVDVAKEPQRESIRILHAPSRPLAKGSFVFRQVVAELNAEGYSIDFVELVGVPNRVVLEELQNCDFVIDELYSDTPLAMFATEAAMFGKPAIVGGYYAAQLNTDNHNSVLPPSLYVVPEEIKQAIRKMIDDVEFRADMGMRARDFIINNWSARMVAKNYLCLIDGDIPKHWISNPNELDYFLGWGLSKENWRKQVGEYIFDLGSDALLLNHNPRLEQKVLNEIKREKGAPLL